MTSQYLKRTIKNNKTVAIHILKENYGNARIPKAVGGTAYIYKTTLINE